MIKHTYLQILLLSIITIACKSGNDREAAPNTLQRIDMTTATEVDLDQFVEEVTCFPLQKVRDGARGNWKLVAYKDYFYLWYFDKFQIQVFDNKGARVRSIDESYKGKGKIQSPCDIFIDAAKEELNIVDGGVFLRRYTLLGDYIETTKLEAPVSKVAYTNDGAIVAYTDLIDRTNEYLFHSYINGMATLNKSSVEKGLMKRCNASYVGASFTTDLHTQDVYALIDKKGVIYKYAAGEMHPYLELDFHGDLFTETYYPEKGFTDKEMSEILNSGKYIHSLNSFHCVDANLIFKSRDKECDYYRINLSDNSCCKSSTLFEGYAPSQYIPLSGSDGTYVYIEDTKSALAAHYKGKKSKHSSINEFLSSDSDEEVVILRLKLNFKS